MARKEERLTFGAMLENAKCLVALANIERVTCAQPIVHWILRMMEAIIVED